MGDTPTGNGQQVEKLYFGCLHEPGHGFYWPDGSSATYKNEHADPFTHGRLV